MPKRTISAAVLLSCVALAHAAALRPVDIATFFVTPGQPAVLRWKVTSGQLAEPIQYTVRDYWDCPVASGQAKQAADGTIEATVKLEQGFYDIELPAAGQRLGLVALPAHEGRPDEFFAIDSALSWLVGDDQAREGLIRDLRRSGVTMSRERLSSGSMHPADGRWEWDAFARFETLRQTYHKHGVQVLEMFHDTPGWLGHVGKYPDNLVAAARLWRGIGPRWRSTWGGLEVWNEPDIFFGGLLPADQYVPLVKTVAYALAQDRIDLPVVSGVTAHYNRAFLDTAARNGMLDVSDAVSFHTYGRAPEMEALVANYRSWLRAHQRENMPLWITECGRPWKKGPDRPPADQDALSALDITMKGIEARACGIARYFPFVYPFFIENENNFGMMGRCGTPLRSMAAYARLVGVLGHKGYLGDLKCDDPAIRRARVFGDQGETVVVLYTGKPDAEARVRLDLPPVRIEGIDGRALKPSEEKTVPIPDGLSYVWLERKAVGDRLQADTPAARLWAIGQQPRPQRLASSPIVLRFQADAKLLQAKTEGYRLLGKTPGKLPLRVRAFNLSAQPQRLALRLELSSETARTTHPQVHDTTAPAEGFVDLAWDSELGAALAGSDHVRITVSATGEGAAAVSPLVVEIAIAADGRKK